MDRMHPSMPFYGPGASDPRPVFFVERSSCPREAVSLYSQRLPRAAPPSPSQLSAKLQQSALPAPPHLQAARAQARCTLYSNGALLKLPAEDSRPFSHCSSACLPASPSTCCCAFPPRIFAPALRLTCTQRELVHFPMEHSFLS